MTEIGIGTFVAPEDREGALNGSMGITAPFRETKVVDDDGDDVPVGDVGHLCVRGAGILRGYHNRPEANAELFLEHGWFQTGDLARFDPDGYVYYSGRVKDTIRRSGENIAAAEVEAVVVQVEGVTAAAAVPVPDDYRGEEVKVYVVLDEGRTAEGITPALILDWCGQRLAAFKVPRYVEYIDELPMTASGKVSKRHLKDAKDDLRVGSYDRVDVVWR
jgi:crotonobetaine/carnitine-CoA ligase